MKVDDIKLLIDHITKHFPDVVENAALRNKLAQDIFHEGMRQCGWRSWERDQEADTAMEGERVATLEEFFGSSIHYGDVVRDLSELPSGEYLYVEVV